MDLHFPNLPTVWAYYLFLMHIVRSFSFLLVIPGNTVGGMLLPSLSLAGRKKNNHARKIILQKAVEIQEGDTPEILQRRVMEQAEWILLPKAAEIVAGRILKGDQYGHLQD